MHMIDCFIRLLFHFLCLDEFFESSTLARTLQTPQLVCEEHTYHLLCLARFCGHSLIIISLYIFFKSYLRKLVLKQSS